MFYEVELRDIVRVPPTELKGDIKKMIEEILKTSFIGNVGKEYGMIITINEIKEISEGIVIPEDGGVYYKVTFKAITFVPLINELVYGIITSIAEFGAFASIGPVDALIHISQIMDDEVSISGREALQGRNTKKVLKVNDIVKARVVTVSYKDIVNLKVSLTMKQPGLGKLEWLESKDVKVEKKETKTTKKK